MSDPLFDGLPGSLPTPNDKGPNGILDERDQILPEDVSPVERYYNFRDRIFRRLLPRFKHSWYLADVCTDAYLDKGGPLQYRGRDVWRSHKTEIEQVTPGLSGRERDETQTEDDVPSFYVDSAEEEFLKKEQQKEFIAAFKTCLNAREQNCLILRVRDDMSSKEIAQRLGMTDTNVDQMVSRARKKLHKHIFGKPLVEKQGKRHL